MNLVGRVASVVTGQGYTEAFEYSAGGLVTKKSLTVPGALRALAAIYGYDNEGQRTSLKYPDITDDAGYVAFTGKTVTSSFDSFGRPLSLNDGTDLVRNGAWSLAGRLTGMEVRNGAVYEARTWTYNNLGQLTGQTATGVNLEYTYPAVNDGRLLKRKDNVSGEEVAYQYDELGRLISAATTAPTGGWGLAWVYDGFGNRLQQNITKGSAYSMQLTVDAATNRLSGSGFAYDANGNQTGWSTPSGPVSAVYDVENRMASITTPSSAQSYHYSAANQRLRKPRDAASEDIFFYGLGGELLGIYGRYNGATSFYPSAGWQKEYVYFAGVQVLPAAVEDRVGSVMKSAEWGGTSSYFPYGEQMGGASGDDRKKFGTYWRDSSSGLDYAQNRYYGPGWGRFTSADPYVMSGGLGNPQGWNRYAYVGGDPVNKVDPRGLMEEPASGCGSAGTEYCIDDPQLREALGPGGGSGVVAVGSSRGALLSVLREAVASAALTMLAQNLLRAGTSSARVPAFLQVVGDCWQDGVQGSGSLAYTRIVTYQVLDSEGQPMDGRQLSGISISESFREVTGNTRIQEAPGTWPYGSPTGIQPNGTFTDYISAGGLPPLATRSGAAFQSFQALGFLSNGIPLIPQFMTILGFGSPTTALDVVLEPNNVTINGIGYGRDPSRRCR